MQKQLPAEQHNVEIHENRRAWESKPILRAAYGALYQEIARHLGPRPEGTINVELGSGMGNIREFVPDCVTTDLFPNPWLDRVENAYRLSFADSSVANLILFDVWHHLAYPANALAEAARVLVPGGRLLVMDPAMSLTGRLVYGLFHHEPLGFSAGFSPQPVEMPAPQALPYFAAQSSAHRLLQRGEIPELLDGWRVRNIIRITSFAYLASGGFRGRQLYPDFALPFIRQADRVFGLWPGVFAARLLAVLSKEG
jgi:SAM-dependent methyltransferase